MKSTRLTAALILIGTLVACGKPSSDPAGAPVSTATPEPGPTLPALVDGPAEVSRIQVQGATYDPNTRKLDVYAQFLETTGGAVTVSADSLEVRRDGHRQRVEAVDHDAVVPIAVGLYINRSPVFAANAGPDGAILPQRNGLGQVLTALSDASDFSSAHAFDEGNVSVLATWSGRHDRLHKQLGRVAIDPDASGAVGMRFWRGLRALAEHFGELETLSSEVPMRAIVTVVGGDEVLIDKPRLLAKRVAAVRQALIEHDVALHVVAWRTNADDPKLAELATLAQISGGTIHAAPVPDEDPAAAIGDPLEAAVDGLRRIAIVRATLPPGTSSITTLSIAMKRGAGWLSSNQEILTRAR